jgi:putative ATP-dependent endonuclease of OLD family
MRLARLRMRNFRCYRGETAIDFEDITALVGGNGSGKSSVMDALDIFFNEGNPDKDDASKGGTAADLAIICEFDDLPEKVVLDDANPSSLSAEGLLNAEGRLEIHKLYSGHLANPKCTGVYAYALHPTADGVSDLLQLSVSDLKKRAKELHANLDGVDTKANAQIRKRVRQSVPDLALKATLVPLNDGNARIAWDSLKTCLPAFALFKPDQDAEAQGPLKATVREAIKEKEAELNAIVDHVEKEVKRIAESTLNKLSEMDPTLATQLNPQFAAPRWDKLFKASITGYDAIPINKRGSGVKRLILLNFFRAKAEQIAKERRDARVIYAVEEPETSQQASNQRMLVRAFAELALENQVILSTHTQMLARSLPDHNLRYIDVHEDQSRRILNGGQETDDRFAKALGVLPDNSVRIFIGVEGKHDISFLLNICEALRSEGLNILDLARMELDGELIFFPLGGSNLALWTCRLQNLNRPEFHLFDRDNPPPQPAKYQSEADAINLRPQCKAQITAMKEIENYLHMDAINQAYQSFGISLGLAGNFGPFDDVPLGIAQRVHSLSGSTVGWDQLDRKTAANKISNAKAHLNKIAPAFMTKALLDVVDPTGDLLSWFHNIRSLLMT